MRARQIYTNEGFRDGRWSTKELCDALVIFGEDNLIFSDNLSVATDLHLTPLGASVNSPSARFELPVTQAFAEGPVASCKSGAPR